VVISDIPANAEVKLEPECYFPVGNVAALRERLQQALSSEITDVQRETRRQWVASVYDWNDIAVKTLAVYKKALGRRVS